MEISNFKKALEPVKQAIEKLDRLNKEAGEHFNEDQLSKAAALLTELKETASKAVDEAEDALHEQPPIVEDEGIESIPDDEVDDSDTREPQDGDVFVIRQGRPYRIREAKQGALATVFGNHASIESLVENGPVVVGQTGSEASDAGGITEQALNSLKANADKTKERTTSGVEANAVSAPQPGVKTEETGERIDLAKGDEVGLASSEADISKHFTGDGSRVIEDAAKGEGLKTLVADTATQRNPIDAGTNDTPAAIEALGGGNGEAHQFTSSPTADQPADTAAVASGAQEVVPHNGDPAGETGVVVETKLIQPGDAGTLIEHPIDPMLKTSGDGIDAGDWTAMGWDKSGFPVPKGSPEDVSNPNPDLAGSATVSA